MNEESLKMGAIGEHVVWNFLTKLSNFRSIVDVRDDKRFQQYDVDFLVEMKKGNYIWIEVKEDNKAQDTGNIVFEEYSNYEYKTDGCFRKTKAEYIFYYLNESKELYIINASKLRNYVDANKENMYLVSMGDNAMGYLLPISELKRNGIIGKHYTGVY